MFEKNSYDNDYQYNRSKEEAYIRAKKKVEQITGFYWHLASYVIVNIFLIIVIGANSSEGYWSFGAFSTAIFWGIGLVIHFVCVFGQNVLFSKAWQERKIREYMEKDQHQNWE